MFCGNCGAKVSADMKFCNKCGTPVALDEVSSNGKKPKEKKKSHTLAKFIFILVLLLCIPAAFFAGSLKYKFDNKDTKIEGAGFKTAEDALKAFAEAFAEKDIDKMYSCCAVESYVDNYSYEKNLERMQAYTPITQIMTGDDDASNRLNVSSRQSDLFKLFYKMYLYASVSEDSFTMEGITVSLDKMDLDDIVDELKGPSNIRSIKVEDISGPRKYGDFNSNDHVKKMIESLEGVYGGEIDSLAVKFEIDGEEFIIFADLIKYDDKWYVLTTQGIYGSMAGIPATSGGLTRYK